MGCVVHQFLYDQHLYEIKPNHHLIKVTVCFPVKSGIYLRLSLHRSMSKYEMVLDLTFVVEAYMIHYANMGIIVFLNLSTQYTDLETHKGE